MCQIKQKKKIYFVFYDTAIVELDERYKQMKIYEAKACDCLH